VGAARQAVWAGWRAEHVTSHRCQPKTIQLVAQLAALRAHAILTEAGPQLRTPACFPGSDDRGFLQVIAAGA